MAETVQPPESDRWRRRGACVGVDQETFFTGETEREALRLCRRCEVTEECLAYALWSGERFGTWGGKTERQRRKLARVVHGTPEHYVNGCRCVPCRRAYVEKRQATVMIQAGLALIADVVRDADHR